MSAIEWTDETWTPFRAWGNEREALGWACEKVSEGCQHCYAETINRRLGTGLPYSVKAVEKSGGEHYLDEKALLKPLSWKRPRRIFVSSMTDIFGEWVPFDWLDRVFAVMALTPQHTYQVLTKRPERMREYMTQPADPDTGLTRWEWVSWLMGEEHTGYMDYHPEVRPTWPLPNLWLGTSVELQRWADVRVPELLATPAAVRFLSCEPLLGPVDLPICACGANYVTNGLIHGDRHVHGIDWVIVGGESGPGARPFDLAWARSIVSQCRAAGVACFYKQGGKSNRCPHSSKGGCFECFPDDLKVREMPHVG